MEGPIFICLANDNLMQGIDAEIKVFAIIETTTFENIDITEAVVTPRYEKQIRKEPVITTMNVPVGVM